jgi:hypothetical protein
MSRFVKAVRLGAIALDLENELGPAHLDKSAPLLLEVHWRSRGIIVSECKSGTRRQHLRIQKAVAVTAHDVTLRDQTRKIIPLESAVHIASIK